MVIVAVVMVRLRRPLGMSGMLLLMMRALTGQMIVAVWVKRDMLIRGMRERERMVIGGVCDDGSSAAGARRHLLRRNRRTLNLGAAQARTAALVKGRRCSRGARRHESVYRRRGAGGRGVGAAGITAIATRIGRCIAVRTAFHQQAVTDVIAVRGRTSHRKLLLLISTAIRTSAVALIIGHNGR